MSLAKTTYLDLDRIQTWGQTMPRAAMDHQAILDYAQRMIEGDRFPPLEVVFDGQEYWLCDGFHRYQAARNAGRTRLPAIIHPGSKDDAVWRAVAANTAHGVRRTHADKEVVVIRALLLRPGLSDRAIAEHVVVSHVTVAKYRCRLISAGHIDRLGRRLGLDGKHYPAKPGDATHISPPAAAKTWVASPGFDTPEQAAAARCTGAAGGQIAHLAANPWRSNTSATLSPDERGDEQRRIARSVLGRRGEVGRMISAIETMRCRVGQAVAGADPLYAELDHARFAAGARAMLDALRRICPSGLCRACSGSGCPACGHQGWRN